MRRSDRGRAPDLFEHGVTIRLTAHQRNFLARKVIASLTKARANRRRLEAKYSTHATATRPMDSVIHSLHDLGRKLGLTATDMDAPAGLTRGGERRG